MKKFNLYGLAIGLLLLTACGDDDESKTTFTVDDAKQSMSKLSTDMSADIVDITSAEGVNAVGDLVSILELNDPFAGRLANAEETKSWFKKHAVLFKTVFVSKPTTNSRLAEEGFDFNAHVGTYNWNPETESFDKVEGGDIIVINFPQEGSSQNNISLRITEFSEEQFEDEFDIYYMPTAIAADLSIDDVEQIALDFSAAYNTNGDPVSASVALFLNPYTFSVSFDDTQTKTVSGSASIKKDQETIVATSLTVDFLTQQKEDIDLIDGFVQYRTIKIQGEVDVNGIESAENPDPNDFVNLALFDGSNKIGDIIFETEMVDGFEEDVPYVLYADGTKAKLEDVLKPVIDEIEDFEEEVEGWSAG